jgi:putative Mg2+ transporter-C (MgtC) family protein
MNLTGQEVLALCVAAVFGAVIGSERELSGKPVGLRTNILICLGACIFTVVSRKMGLAYGGSPVRMAAHVVGGIGFLGAGAIIRDQGTVHGATTAATIWLVASIGIACGAGFLALALVATGLTFFVLRVLSPVEKRLLRRAETAKTCNEETHEKPQA